MLPIETSVSQPWVTASAASHSSLRTFLLHQAAAHTQDGGNGRDLLEGEGYSIAVKKTWERALEQVRRALRALRR